MAAFAVIKTLKSDFSVDDIQKVTLLPSVANSCGHLPLSVYLYLPLFTYICPHELATLLLPAERNLKRASGFKDNILDIPAAATAPTDMAGTSTVNPVSTGSGSVGIDTTAQGLDTKPGSAIVSVSSSGLATEIISAKIVWKKLCKAQIPVDPIASAQLTIPSQHATINGIINAYLQPDLYKLRRLVHTKSKNQRNNLVTYMSRESSILNFKESSTLVFGMFSALEKGNTFLLIEPLLNG